MSWKSPYLRRRKIEVEYKNHANKLKMKGWWKESGVSGMEDKSYIFAIDNTDVPKKNAISGQF